MTRARALIVALVGALVVSGIGAAAPATKLSIAPVKRLPFPERGFVVSVPEAVDLEDRAVVVRENGVKVGGVRVDPLAGSGLRVGVVLALDTSESMAGEPAAGALRAARQFVSRRSENQAVGIVTFNGNVSVLRAPTRNDASLRRALAVQPPLAYGTRINDALLRSLELLKDARLSSGSIVLLSDGADVGSSKSLADAVKAAKEQEVRVFTVGLRSGAFDAKPLETVAIETGGAFVEARSAAELAAIYDELGERLAGEYLIRYRSGARPMSQVDVEVQIAGTGRAAATYVAPTPSKLPPFKRSFLSKFLLSPVSPVFISLMFGGLVCLLLFTLSRKPQQTVVTRVNTFATGSLFPDGEALAEMLRGPARNQQASGWWMRLERDLALARMSTTPQRVVVLTAAGAVAIVLLALLLSAPAFALLALGSPLTARAVIRRKLKTVRDEFADQFPANLQVLASALRSGNSFNGALGVVVDNAHEPARSELARVLQDDRLGVLPEDALRKLARRMGNRDVEQVALLAELQRTTGGNSAEILDTVVATIRERADLRRLVRTLTAQGRMARWILTALPLVGVAVMWAFQPQVMVNFFTSGGGQIALVIAVAMVTAGSLMIQRIIDIEL